MSKIRKIWNENRVLMVLAIILLICFITIIGVSLTYFYGSSESEYGNRLEGIEKVQITKKDSDKIVKSLKSEEKVEKASLVNKGKMIYLTIGFEAGTPIEEAKLVADGAIELFNKDELEFYDINITIKATGTTEVPKYTIMGARNSGGSGIIVWNNNTIEEEETEE